MTGRAKTLVMFAVGAVAGAGGAYGMQSVRGDRSQVRDRVVSYCHRLPQFLAASIDAMSEPGLRKGRHLEGAAMLLLTERSYLCAGIRRSVRADAIGMAFSDAASSWSLGSPSQAILEELLRLSQEANALPLRD